MLANATVKEHAVKRINEIFGRTSNERVLAAWRKVAEKRVRFNNRRCQPD